MKVLILAAGYGTRLERDLKADTSGKYVHLLGVPKPLVPIGGKPLITRWMEYLNKEDSIEQVYVVTNARYLGKFQQWCSDWPGVKVIDDGTLTNECRIGAVGAIQLCLDQIKDTDDDLLIIGGDTLFFQDFKIKNVLQDFKKNKEQVKKGAQVLCYRCKDDETTKFGIVEVDENYKVKSFLEKPSPDQTLSRWACPCFYIISRDSFPFVKEFLEEKKDSPLQERDAPGNFIRYLGSRLPVYASIISGRFDVGGLHSYIECDQHFLQHNNELQIYRKGRKEMKPDSKN